jgi:hypothetical protein
MPTPTYTLIASSTVGAGGAANITFSSIPATYTDLALKVTGRINSSGYDMHMLLRFNGNAGTSYSFRRLIGYQSTVSSYSETNETSINLYSTLDGTTATANTFGSVDIYIPNYTGSQNKSLSVDAATETNSTDAYRSFYAGLWNDSSAITSINLAAWSTFLQYSTAYLYGISKS